MSSVLVAGFFVGILYAIFAVGMVVVFNGSKTINFAHGETGMMGAFVFTRAAYTWGWPRPVALAAGIAVSAGLAVLTQRLVARPLKGQSALTSMLGTFAIGGVLLVAAIELWGDRFRVQPPLVAGPAFRLGGVYVSKHQLLVLGVVVLVMAGLAVLQRRSRLGLLLRATAMNPQGSQIVGIDVDRLSAFAWGLGGALAGLAGILIAPLVTFGVAFMTAMLVRGLSAFLLGGFTSIPLVAAAALAIAELEAWLQYRSSTAGMVEFGLAVMIVIVLLVRPARLSAAREAFA